MYIVRKILSVLFIAIISGCSNELKDEIINNVDRKCAGQADSNCIVDISKITKFQWDKMFVFPGWTTSDSISRIIGLVYAGNDVQDDHSRLVFTNKNKIVHEEDFVSLDYKNSTISFQGLGDSVARKQLYHLTPSSAIFTVEIGKTKGSCTSCFIYSLMLRPLNPLPFY